MGAILPLLLSGGAALLAAFGVDKDIARLWFPVASVVGAVISLLLFLSAQIQSSTAAGSLGARFKKGVIQWRYPFLWAVALVSITYMAVGPEVRVLTDESTLLSTALAIYQSGKAQLISIGLYFNDQFLPVGLQIPLRPVLYPLLVAMLHMLTGYRLANGFVVSFFGMVVGLTSVIGLARSVGRPMLGYLAAALLMGFPLIALTATSCGLEALNLGLVLLTFYFLAIYIEAPSWHRFESVLYASILAAQCRYETALLIAIVSVAGLINFRLLMTSRLPYRLLIAPWLIIPLVWQRLLSSSINGGDQVESAFGLDYLWTNLHHAAEFFTPTWPSIYPVSGTVVLFGLVGIVATLLSSQALDPDNRSKLHTYLSLVAAYIGGTLVIHCLYYVGDLREPQLMRIGVIYAAVLAIFASYLFMLIARRPIQQLLLLVLVTVICSRGLATASVNAHGKTHAGYLEYKRNLSLIETFPRDGTLVIEHHPVMYVPSRYGTVNFEYANANKQQILAQLNSRILQNILVIQRISNGQATTATTLTPEFELTPILEYRTTADYVVRVSRAEPKI